MRVRGVGLVFVLVITTFVHFTVLSGLWMGFKGGLSPRHYWRWVMMVYGWATLGV